MTRQTTRLLFLVAFLTIPIFSLKDRPARAEGHALYLPVVSHQPFALAVTPFAEGVPAPADVTDMVDPGDGRLLVSLKDGRIIEVDPQGTINSELLLDIRDRVVSDSLEAGLLGLALHPNYQSNGYLYAYFTRRAQGHLVADVVRYQWVQGGVFDPATEMLILRTWQPQPIHQAGALEFGPLDGFLYIASGDGGTYQDEAGNAQSGQSLLGKILRIDVDSGLPYAIPADNPFVNDPEVLDEIWGLGLRNPWRISFDSLTGDLYIGDVGEGDWEEINYQPAGTPGGQNYGWPCYEGPDIFRADACQAGETYVPPIYAYPHTLDTFHCSVVGGYVYRGAALPELYGDYLFADFCGHTIWSLESDAAGSWKARRWGDYTHFWTTFGQRSDGELFLGASNNGRIYQLARAAVAPQAGTN